MSAKNVIIVLLLAGTAGAGAAATVYAMQAADAQRQVEIAEANIDAMGDTIQRYVSDSTQTATLMATQADVNGDSITGLLASLSGAVSGRSQTLRALSTLRLEFSALQGEFESVDVEVHEADPDEPDEPATAEATFEVEGPPIQGSLSVLYRPTLPWTLRTNLTVSPFNQTYSVGCDQLNRAIVNITTPEWVTTTPERGVIAPDVCNPVQPRPVLSFSMGKSVWGIAGGVVGWLLHDLLSGSTASPSNPYPECYDEWGCG